MTAPDPRSFNRPQQPVFRSFEEERQHHKTKLAAAFRVFWKLGYDEGVMGHISFRDPEHHDRFWLNPFAVSFGEIKVSDLVCVSLDGQLVEGDGFLHPGGVPQHSAVYTAQPGVKAIAHVHSSYAKTWSTLGRHLEPISTEAAVFHGKHSIYDTFAHGEGLALGEAAQDVRAVILKNHGILTVGQTVDEAAYLFISLEKVCKEQLLAKAAGEPQLIPEEKAKRISDFFSAATGWLNFQPQFQSIVREQPDLLL